MGAHIRTVGIAGTGTIGASWAAFYAGKGMAVQLFDASAESRQSGLDKARQCLEDLERFGLLGDGEANAAVGRLRPAARLEELSESEFVHEAASERYEVKTALFAQLDRLVDPHAVLASSSSGLLMTEIQRQMNHPERALIAHPFNPPHLVPLVELVGGKKTSQETLRRMRSFYTDLGKVPVVLQKEVPGHIANRLAAALWREALDLVARGVASVEDVDRALCAGPGLRWALMGQHMIYHLGGGKGGYQHFIDHIGSGWGALWADMADWKEIPAEAREAALAGMAEAMAGKDPEALAARRDEKLAMLVRAIYEE